MAVQPGLRESGCFQPEMFHGFGGVDRFGRIHSDEPDGAIPALIPDYESIAVNDALPRRLHGSGPLSDHCQGDNPGEAQPPAGPLLPQALRCIHHGCTSLSVVGVAGDDGKATGR